MTAPAIRAALERLVELDDGCTADHWHAAITAARAALAAAPEGEPSDEQLTLTYAYAVAAAVGGKRGPFNPEDAERAQLAGLRTVLSRWGRPAAPLKPVAYIHRQGKHWEVSERLLQDDERARGWTEEPLYAAPPAPLEGEVGELVRWLRSRAGIPASPDFPAVAAYLTRAATLLSQLSAASPALVPVAVSERLPGEGDCDAEGKCWRFCPEDDYRWSAWYYSRSNGQETHWLPCSSLPLPAPQGEEVEE